MLPLFSIVIPTHNRASLLLRALNSALQQSYQNTEIIVVSDGSSDNTVEVMSKYKQIDKIKFIHYDTPRGGNFARNIGIRNSNGKYIAFLDDDDVWHQEKIQKQFDIFNDDDTIGIVATGINAIYEGESFTTLYIPPVEYDSSRRILISNCLGSTTTVAIKKDILDEVGGFDENLNAQQDYDLWIRACQVTKCGVVRDVCVDYYNYPSSNQISQHTEKYRKAVLYIENKYFNLFSSLSKKDQKKRKALQEIELSKKSMRNGCPSDARKYAIKAACIYTSKDALICWLASFISPKTARRIRSTYRSLFNKYSKRPKTDVLQKMI